MRCFFTEPLVKWSCGLSNRIARRTHTNRTAELGTKKLFFSIAYTLLFRRWSVESCEQMNLPSEPRPPGIRRADTGWVRLAGLRCEGTSSAPGPSTCNTPCDRRVGAEIRVQTTQPYVKVFDTAVSRARRARCRGLIGGHFSQALHITSVRAFPGPMLDSGLVRSTKCQSVAVALSMWPQCVVECLPMNRSVSRQSIKSRPVV